MFFRASAEEAVGVKTRLASALRPKTECCYTALFRSFVAFCANLNVNKLKVMHILSYIEYLITHNVSVNMLSNHVSACRASSS